MLAFFRRKKEQPLLDEIARVRRDYQEAEAMLNFAAPDFVDHAVHRLNTARSQLNALIREAKRQGLQAWIEPLQPAAAAAAQSREKPPGKEQAPRPGKTDTDCAEPPAQ